MLRTSVLANVLVIVLVFAVVVVASLLRSMVAAGFRVKASTCVPSDTATILVGGFIMMPLCGTVVREGLRERGGRRGGVTNIATISVYS
jgi:hypothetical protein